MAGATKEENHARRSHRFHRPHRHGQGLQGCLQFDPGRDARCLCPQARDRTRRDRSGRGRRRAVGCRAPAGCAGRQSGSPGRAARRLPDRCFGHDARPPVLERPDEHRDRRQAGGDGPDEHRGCRRAGIDQPRPDPRNAGHARPRTDGHARRDLHADAAARRRTNTRCNRSSAPPRHRKTAFSTTRSSRSRPPTR